MKLLNKFIKRGGEGGIPPDVGEEGKAKKKTNKILSKQKTKVTKKIIPKKIDTLPPPQKTQTPNLTEQNLNKIRAEIDTINQSSGMFSDRIARLNEQIGELRALISTNEKEIHETNLTATKAAELVSTVQPEELLIDLRKEQAKLEALKAKVESSEVIYQNIIEEIKKIRNKMHIYRGTDSVIKLNEEVKRDLLEIQKTKAIMESHADKVEKYFIESQKEAKDLEKVNLIAQNLTKAFSDITKNVNDIKIKTETSADKRIVEKNTQRIQEMLKKRTNAVSMAEFKDTQNKINELKSDLDSLSGLEEEFANIIEDNKVEIKGIQEKNSEKIFLLHKELSDEKKKIEIKFNSIVKYLENFSVKLDKAPIIGLGPKIEKIENNIKEKESHLKELIKNNEGKIEEIISTKDAVKKQEIKILNNDIKDLFSDLEKVKKSILKRESQINSTITNLNERVETHLPHFQIKLLKINNNRLKEKLTNEYENSLKQIKEVKDNFHLLKSETPTKEDFKKVIDEIKDSKTNFGKEQSLIKDLIKKNENKLGSFVEEENKIKQQEEKILKETFRKLNSELNEIRQINSKRELEFNNTIQKINEKIETHLPHFQIKLLKFNNNRIKEKLTNDYLKFSKEINEIKKEVKDKIPRQNLLENIEKIKKEIEHIKEFHEKNVNSVEKQFDIELQKIKKQISPIDNQLVLFQEELNDINHNVNKKIEENLPHLKIKNLIQKIENIEDNINKDKTAVEDFKKELKSYPNKYEVENIQSEIYDINKELKEIKSETKDLDLSYEIKKLNSEIKNLKKDSKDHKIELENISEINVELKDKIKSLPRPDKFVAMASNLNSAEREIHDILSDLKENQFKIEEMNHNIMTIKELKNEISLLKTIILEDKKEIHSLRDDIEIHEINKLKALVKEAKSNGYTENQIRRKLHQSGWGSEGIKIALSEV